MDKNMKAILEKWGFKPVDANGRVIGDPKKQRRVGTIGVGGSRPLQTTTDNPTDEKGESNE